MRHARSDYDCVQDASGKIPADEPVLLIRGQDVCAVAAGRAWCKTAAASGADPELVAAMERHLVAILDWQATRACKVPDAPDSALRMTR